MSIPNYAKAALMLAAYRRNMQDKIGQYPPIKEPKITRKHIDGPYIRFLCGSIRWLTLRERLMTKLRLWDAWDIELFEFAEPRP